MCGGEEGSGSIAVHTLYSALEDTFQKHSYALQPAVKLMAWRLELQPHFSPVGLDAGPEWPGADAVTPWCMRTRWQRLGRVALCHGLCKLACWTNPAL